MSPRARLLVALASTGLITYVAVGSLLTRVLGDTSYGQLSIFNEVIRLVLDQYVEPVNVERAMAGARLGMSDALDGDSAYLDAEQFARYQKPEDGQDADVGLVLTRRFGFLMVVAARPGSPAAEAGLRTGDLVKSIDGRHASAGARRDRAAAPPWSPGLERRTDHPPGRHGPFRRVHHSGAHRARGPRGPHARRGHGIREGLRRRRRHG